MVWKAKYTQENYTPGNTRIKRVFAWLPFHINGDVVWLATYEILQLFTVDEYLVPNGDKTAEFKVSRWINLSYKISK